MKKQGLPNAQTVVEQAADLAFIAGGLDESVTGLRELPEPPRAD